MKKILLTIGVLIVLLLASVAVINAATEDEIKTAIEKGVLWLAAQQNPGTGCWGTWNQVAQTGFAVVKLEERAFELGYSSPFDAGYAYHTNVEKGLNCIFANAHSIPISVQPAGDPDTNGNGQGVYFGGQKTYETGIAMMAIAASREPSRLVTTGPLIGKTYKEVLQDAVDYLAFGQNDYPSGQGGWSYQENEQWQEWVWDPDKNEWVPEGPWYSRSDNSNTGYAVLGLRYAESYGFECIVPQFVKDELKIWIDYIQNDIGPAGDPNDGGSGYDNPEGWVNLLKTGNLLFEMAFVGDTTATARVQDAIAYIERHWNDANWDPGWKGPGWSWELDPTTGSWQWVQVDRPHYQATYTLMKGFESLGINTITVAGNPVDWFDEMSTAIVASQSADGSWIKDYWGDQMLATEWALLTLEKIAPPPPTVEGRMTGGGSVVEGSGKAAKRYTHGFELHCDVNKGPNNLQVNWSKGDKFHLTSLDSAACSDDVSISEGMPVAGFDTYAGSGTGRYNGNPGAKIEFKFTDTGEPGMNDLASIKIVDASGNTVLNISGKLENGNHQAHPE